MGMKEVKSLCQLPSGRYLPCGLNIWQKLWWRFVPGVIIKVRWPTGKLVITEDNPLWDWSNGPSSYIIESSDPNDHYRPELTKKVGKQGRHWQWGLTDTDIVDSLITIKIVKSKADWAAYFSIKWS